MKAKKEWEGLFNWWIFCELGRLEYDVMTYISRHAAVYLLRKDKDAMSKYKEGIWHEVASHISNSVHA